MNRDEAAAALGISVRTLNRRVAAGEINVDYVRGVHGTDEARFDPAEIEAYSARPVASRSRPAPSASLAHGEPAPAALAEPVTGLLARIAVALESRNEPEQIGTDARGKSRIDLVQLSLKLFLSLPEAAALSGLPVRLLREAVADGRLKAHPNAGRGKGKIKRPDLDRFAANFGKVKGKSS